MQEIRQINPFVIGNYVSDEYFCDREQETELLKKQLLNGRNMTLISDRRIGKSGLISHLFEQEDVKNRFYTVDIDLYSTGCLAEMVCMFGKEVYRRVHHNPSWRERFFQIISSFRVGFKLDPLTGAPALDLGVGDITTPSMSLEQIFAFLESADKPCIVAFDEFQQIANYEEESVEALLRTHIQRCKQTRFIFAGSRKHLMSQLFLSPAKPFYQSTINLALQPIPRDTYIAFAQTMFEKDGKQLQPDAVGQVYDLMRGVTWYMQVILNEMFSLTMEGDTCTVNLLDVAMENVIRIQEPFYREILAALPAKQKSLLYAIAKEGTATQLTSADFIAKHQLRSTSSVQAALRGLREKELVVDIDNTWHIYDVFFERYILKYIV